MKKNTLLIDLELLQKAHEKCLLTLVDSEVKKVLTQVSKICGKKVVLVSGMGTWIFKIDGSEIVNLDGDFYPQDYLNLTLANEKEEEIPNKAKSLLYQLHQFLLEVNGTYNIYPSEFKSK